MLFPQTPVCCLSLSRSPSMLLVLYSGDRTCTAFWRSNYKNPLLKVPGTSTSTCTSISVVQNRPIESPDCWLLIAYRSSLIAVWALCCDARLVWPFFVECEHGDCPCGCLIGPEESETGQTDK